MLCIYRLMFLSISWLEPFMLPALCEFANVLTSGVTLPSCGFSLGLLEFHLTYALISIQLQHNYLPFWFLPFIPHFSVHNMSLFILVLLKSHLIATLDLNSVARVCLLEYRYNSFSLKFFESLLLSRKTPQYLACFLISLRLPLQPHLLYN